MPPPAVRPAAEDAHPVPPSLASGAAGPAVTMRGAHGDGAPGLGLQSGRDGPCGPSLSSYASAAEAWRACQAAGRLFQPQMNPNLTLTLVLTLTLYSGPDLHL